MASTKGFYSSTPVKDFYLDLWSGINVLKSIDDKLITVESRYNKRPDLFAKDFLGDEGLWWAISLRNKDLLIDPFEDFVTGIQVYVPSSKGLN